MASGWKSRNNGSTTSHFVMSPSVTPISLPETSFQTLARAGSESRIGVRESVPASL